MRIFLLLIIIFLSSCSKDDALNSKVETNKTDQEYLHAFESFNDRIYQLSQDTQAYDSFKILASSLSINNQSNDRKEEFAKMLNYNSFSEYQNVANDLILKTRLFYSQFENIPNGTLKKLEIQKRIARLVIISSKDKLGKHENSYLFSNGDFYINSLIDDGGGGGNDNGSGPPITCNTRYTVCVAAAWSAASYASTFCIGPQAPWCLTAVSVGYAAALAACYINLQDCLKTQPE